jgi:hypothetical protein
MAVLIEADRKDVWARAMQVWSGRTESTGTLLKADLRAAVDATDQWIEDNAAAFNAALPVAARNALTASQKAELFSIVALKRYGVL